jgi:hypothetical protein
MGGLRYLMAVGVCVGTWFVPPMLMEAANGIDHSDQAFGRVLVAALGSCVSGPLLAWWFLVTTRKAPSVGEIAREKTRREAEQDQR